MARPTPAPRGPEKAAATHHEAMWADARLPGRPTVMLVLDLLTSTWSLARTLLGAPFRLIHATRERTA